MFSLIGLLGGVVLVGELILLDPDRNHFGQFFLDGTRVSRVPHKNLFSFFSKRIELLKIKNLLGCVLQMKYPKSI